MLQWEWEYLIGWDTSVWHSSIPSFNKENALSNAHAQARDREAAQLEGALRATQAEAERLATQLQTATEALRREEQSRAAAEANATAAQRHNAEAQVCADEPPGEPLDVIVRDSDRGRLRENTK